MYKFRMLFIVFISLFSISLFAEEMFQTVKSEEATLVKEDSSKEFCNVCGMHLVKHYKTNHATEFKNGHKEQYCSLHCQAQIHNDFEDKIKEIKVVDTNSLKLIDATKAFYVVGSSKEGTMSMISKYAFSSKDEALKFQKEFGGEIHNFEDTLKIAKDGLSKDNETLDKKEFQWQKKVKKSLKLCVIIQKKKNLILLVRLNNT